MNAPCNTDFAEIQAPLTLEEFFADYYGNELLLIIDATERRVDRELFGNFTVAST